MKLPVLSSFRSIVLYKVMKEEYVIEKLIIS